MSRVKIYATAANRKAFTELVHSDEIAEQLEDVAQPVLDEARRDPNDFYVSTLRMKRFHSSGRAGRVSVQVGAAPVIGARVEAKRGTLARAVDRAI